MLRRSPVRSGAQTFLIGTIAAVLAYGVHLQPSGFLLLTADDRLTPVFGYSTDNDLDLDYLKLWARELRVADILDDLLKGAIKPKHT